MEGSPGLIHQKNPEWFIARSIPAPNFCINKHRSIIWRQLQRYLLDTSRQKSDQLQQFQELPHLIKHHLFISHPISVGELLTLFGALGDQQHHEVQQRKMLGAAPGTEQCQAQAQTGRRVPWRKEPGGAVQQHAPHEPANALAAKRANRIFETSTASWSKEVVLLLYYCWCSLALNSACSSGLTIYKGCASTWKHP